MGEEADAENTNLILDLILDLRKHKKPPWVVFCLFIWYSFSIARVVVGNVLESIFNHYTCILD